jgi:hypothetical protein
VSYPVFYPPASTTLYIPFASYDKTNGASVTMSGLAVTDIEIYKNGSTTQRASDNGYTLLDTDGIDFDGITGLHGFSIDLSDNSDASFYAVGSWYWVVVSTITVDSTTITFIAACFRIMPAESVTGKPKVDVDTFGARRARSRQGFPTSSWLMRWPTAARSAAPRPRSRCRGRRSSRRVRIRAR